MGKYFMNEVKKLTFMLKLSIILLCKCAPVAQLDRVADFESVGRGFESLRVR